MYDAECVFSEECEGEEVVDYGFPGGAETYNPCTGGSPYNVPWLSGDATTSEDSTTQTIEIDRSTQPEPGGSTTIESTLEDEFTTAELEAAVASEMALESWSAASETPVTAFRNLSPDESSLSLRQIKLTINYAQTGSCYRKIWIKRTWTPEGGSPSETILTVTLTATGNPCLNFAEKAYDDDDNLLEQPFGDVSGIEPEEDGTLAYTIQKWSCEEGYTPPDDGSANGLPAAA